MALLKLVFWKGKRQIPFFKVYHPSTEKPKALVGFELRTEPELGTGDSHSTSTPPPPHRGKYGIDYCWQTLIHMQVLQPGLRKMLLLELFLCCYQVWLGQCNSADCIIMDSRPHTNYPLSVWKRQ